MFGELLLLCYIRCVVLALGLLHLQWLDCVLYERTLTFTVIDIISAPEGLLCCSYVRNDVHCTACGCSSREQSTGFPENIDLRHDCACDKPCG